MRFNDDIYFYLSRGLIDPNILEAISNGSILGSIVIAPGMILKEIWDSDEFKSLFHEIFNNLHEDTKKERQFFENANNRLI